LKDGRTTGKDWQETTKVKFGFHSIHIFSSFVLISDVSIDSVKTIRDKPLKSAVYGSIGAFIYGCCKTNPNHQTFIEQLRKSESEVALVPLDSQNPTTTDHLKMLNRIRNNETLRITSLGLFSLMWVDNYASSQATFDATCEYLKPELRNFHERIIDIGWWNNWWNLQRKMKDYDIVF
jgi:hypothetical protein